MKNMYLLLLFSTFISVSAIAGQTAEVEGIVSEIKGQRFLLTREDGTETWMTTSTKLENDFVGLKVSGEIEPVGDTIRMVNPVFAGQSRENTPEKEQE